MPTAKAEAEATSTEFLVYGDIGFSWFDEGVQAKSVKTWLDKHDKDAQLTVRINSPGGDAFEGVAIYNLLKDAPQHITIKIDGLALSAASIIAMGGDEVRMAENALLMIHNAWTFAMGDSDELRKTADRLDKVNDSLAVTYVRRTKKPRDEVLSLMSDETWFSAEEAKEHNFIDTIEEGGEVVSVPEDRAKAYGFRRAPAGRAATGEMVRTVAQRAPLRIAASAANHRPPERGPNEEDMDSKELQTALDKKTQELGAALARAETAERNAKAYEEQNGKLVTERDAAVAKAKTFEDSDAERHVKAMIGVKFAASEYDAQLELCKTNRGLFDKLASQRADMTLLKADPIGASVQKLPEPIATTADDSAPDEFDRAVNAMPLG